jgi:hypothetical protein
MSATRGTVKQYACSTLDLTIAAGEHLWRTAWQSGTAPSVRQVPLNWALTMPADVGESTTIALCVSAVAFSAQSATKTPSHADCLSGRKMNAV